MVNHMAVGWTFFKAHRHIGGPGREPKFPNENYWKFIVKRRIGRQFGIQRNGDLKSQVVDLIEEVGYVALKVGT